MHALNPLRILIGDCRETLKTLPDESVHCCVTSPPYWGLRDYGTATWSGGLPECDHANKHGSQGETGQRAGRTFTGAQNFYKEECLKCGAKRIDAQLGLEKTPELYVANMVAVFREVRRVLRSDGTLWLNLGDSYCSTAPGTMGDKLNQRGILSGVSDRRAEGSRKPRAETPTGMKPKDLVGIPWMVAFALRADGWYLRQWMPWVKRNAMPESVQDRPSTSCETFFLLTKSASYFYDAEAVKMEAAKGSAGIRFDKGKTATNGNGRVQQGEREESSGRSRRNGDWFFDSDWQGMQTDEEGWPVAMIVNPQPYADAHFATFPPKLVQPCILAGTSAKGCCPDCGAPWERIMDDGEPDIEHQKACGSDQNGAYDGQSTKDYLAGGAQDASATKARILAGMKKRRTLDWTPTCKCGREDTIPCTVLDPFLGSGTTAKVAIENGRHAIGNELNPEYETLIHQRTSTTMGLGI